MLPVTISRQENAFCVSDLARPHYLGSFVCNILGDRAYLYLKGHELTAEIHNAKREITLLTGSQIRGGRDMPLGELIQLVQTIAAPFLFASYQQCLLRIFARDFQEIQKNQFLKPRITFPSKHFTRVRREEILSKLQKSFQEKQIVIVLNDPSVPLKRVGKTEIVTHYFEEHREEYTHAFWIQAFDPWYFQQDMEKMANSLEISIEKIREWLSDNTSYLIVFDGVEDHQFIREYLPESPKGHIVITSRDNLFNDDPLKIGLFAPEEGIMFLYANAKGSQEDAQRVAQSLGHVPSSMYRAIETMEAKDLVLSNYPDYCQVRLDEHAERAKDTGNLPSRNKDFVGREPELVALEESFSKNKPVVLAANAGLGGIGKTQIALQYAYRTCPNYNLIWWINCGNMQISYDDLAKKLGVHITDEEKRQENGLIKRANLYLEGKPGWLLIFDNAEDEKSLEGLLPRSGGHILITSRNPTWDKTQTEVFGIEVFKREESIDLILKVTSRYDQEKEAGQLAEQLQDLPLAIAQAAAYIRETKVSIQEYIEDFKKFHKALWNREEATNNYESTVSVTWNISMEKIQEIEKQDAITPQAIALPLMQICSFFAPNDIPREALLLPWLRKEYGKIQQDEKACLEDLNQALELLERFSMIGSSEAGISIHALVQTVIRDKLEVLERGNFLTRGLIVFHEHAKLYDVKSPQNSLCIELLLPHSETLMQHCNEFEIIKKSPEFSEVLDQLCQSNHYFGHFFKAKKYAREMREIVAKNDHDSSSYSKAQYLNSMSVAYQSLGEAKEGEIYMENSLKICRSWPSHIHPECEIFVLNNGGTAYRIQGEFEKSLEYFKQALRKHELLWLGSDSSLKASILNNIGIVSNNLGQTKEALENLELALEMKRRIHGNSNHSEIAKALSNIGSIYTVRGELEAGLGYLDEALNMNQKLYPGKNHPDVAAGLNNIGRVYKDLGKLEKGLEYVKKALEMYKALYGEFNHPVIAGCLESLGMFCQDLSRKERALDYFKQSHRLRKDIFPNQDHPDVATIFNRMGEMHQDLENTVKAKKYFKKALAVYGRSRQISKCPEEARCLDNMGLTLRDEGNVKEGLEYLMRAFTMRKEFHRTNPSDRTARLNLAVSLNNVGLACLDLEKTGEALKYLLEALKIHQILYSDSIHADLATSLDNVGLGYLQNGEVQIGLDYLCRGLEMRKRLHPNSDHIDIARSLNHQGLALQEANRMRDAETCLLSSLNMKEKLLQNSDHLTIAESLQALGLFYRKFRDPQNELSYLLKAHAMFVALYRGLTHPNLAYSFSHVANAYLNSGETDLALENTKKCYDLLCSLYPTVDDPRLKLCEENLKNIEKIKKIENFANIAIVCNMLHSGHYDQSIDSFIKILEEKGPMSIYGEFGKHCYEDSPIDCEKHQFYKILGWRKDAHRMQKPKMQWIVVVAAIEATPLANGGGYIYFVDPNDSSNSNNQENNIAYKISYKNFKRNIRPFISTFKNYEQSEVPCDESK